MAVVQTADEQAAPPQLSQAWQQSGIPILTGADYDAKIISPAGAFVGGQKGQFITLADPQDKNQKEANLISELQQLQKTLNEKVEFSVFNNEAEPNLRYTLECYNTPCSYFIEPFEGRTHMLVGEDVGYNSTLSWIEDQTFKNSCFKFKATPRMPDWKLYWGQAKQVVREKYDTTLRDFIEFYLRKVSFSWAVDADNTDYKNITSLHQKRDRQMIMIFGLVYWILETIWDFATATPEKKKQSKVKSKISSSLKDVKPEE